jgi:hypothetical protein
MGRRKIYKAPPSLKVEAPQPSVYEPDTEWREPLTRVCIRKKCGKEFIVVAPHQWACEECQPLHRTERRHVYYVEVELPNIDRVYDLHAKARARRCPTKTKDCAVALLHDKASRNGVLTGAKLFSGKFGSVIVMVAGLYDKIGGDAILKDAHAKCCKTFLAKRSAVTCSDDCSDAWYILYRSGFDLINRDAILEKRRETWATKAKEINAARRAKRKKPRAPARKPWLAEGISRTTWYKRNPKGISA